MKPVSFAALFLVLPVVANAEIRLTGEARMGLVHESGQSRAIADVRLTAHASATTDNGVEFGAVVDLDSPVSPAIRNQPPRAYVYISTGNLTLRTGSGVGSATGLKFRQTPKLDF